MEEAAIELTQMVIEIEKCERVSSLFQLTISCMIPYSYGWRLLRLAQTSGLLTVESRGAGLPLDIASTEHGRAVVAQKECGKVAKWQEAPI